MKILDLTNGATFDDADVARCYAHRAPYAPALYDFVLTLTPGRERALDLGCGPGKIAHVLAPHFNAVDAVDPSGQMLAAGRATGGQNISWIKSSGEEFESSVHYDLIAAGASLHWMRHDIVFPKLARMLRPGGLMAVIDGDDAVEPSWQGAHKAFLVRWLARLGQTYDEKGFSAAVGSYRGWMDVAGEQSFVFEHTQSLDDYVTCQHSRATWSRAVLGERMAAEFDADLCDMLSQFAEDGKLCYRVKSNLVWGIPRIQSQATPR